MIIQHPLFWVLYIGLSVIVGLGGMNRRMGFLGFFILSLLITPLLGLLNLIITSPKADAQVTTKQDT
jgi:hypothetical protein